MAKVKFDPPVQYQFCFTIDPCLPDFIRCIKYGCFAEYTMEMRRMGDDYRMYEAMNQNRGVLFTAICKLKSEPLLQHVQKAVKVLLVFDFSPEQLKTNAVMLANAVLQGITLRAAQIYQLMDAGVQTKNIHDYLAIETGTVYSNCSTSRGKLGFDEDDEVITVLKASNPLVLFG